MRALFCLPITAVLVPAAGCANAREVPFADPETVAYVHCVDRYEAAVDSKCRLSQRKLNQVSAEGWTPLLWLLARAEILPETMGKIIKSGANPHLPGGPTAAGYAIRELPIGYLEELVAIGLDINSIPRPTEDRGWDYSMLFSAVASADLRKVRYLVDRGATIDIRDNLGRTPLISAGLVPKEIPRFLLERGADPFVVADSGQDVCSILGLQKSNESSPPEDIRAPEDYHRVLLLDLQRRGVFCRTSP